MSEAIWEFFFSIMYSKLDSPFLGKSALPWTHTETRLAVCTLWWVAFARCVMMLLIPQAAAEALPACVQRVSLALWKNAVLMMGTILSKANDVSSTNVRLHWGDESYWSLIYLWVQQYSLWHCTYMRNCCHWLEHMLSRKLPWWVIQWGFGPPKLGLWSLGLAIKGEPTWEVSLTKEGSVSAVA